MYLELEGGKQEDKGPTIHASRRMTANGRASGPGGSLRLAIKAEWRNLKKKGRQVERGN